MNTLGLSVFFARRPRAGAWRFAPPRMMKEWSLFLRKHTLRRHSRAGGNPWTLLLLLDENDALWVEAH
jgi:hypothetical protein